MKNIPIPSNQSYLKSLFGKLESFIKRLTWKVFYFDTAEHEEIDSRPEGYGFKSEKTPPQHEDLGAFERDLYEMARTVKFILKFSIES